MKRIIRWLASLWQTSGKKSAKKRKKDSSTVKPLTTSQARKLAGDKLKEIYRVMDLSG